ncbi:hypothetical protein D3C81_2032300 [compost metagenome]
MDNSEGVYVGYDEIWAEDGVNETGNYSSVYVTSVTDLGYDVGATSFDEIYATAYAYYDAESGVLAYNVYDLGYNDEVVGYADLNGDGSYSSNEYFDEYYEGDV